MINKKIIISLLLFNILLILSLNGILAYTLKLPLCTPTNNESCIDYATVGAITNAPQAMIYLGSDGNLYLTNDTQIQYTIINNTNISYLTTYQNVSNYYVYNYTFNATNGSIINVTIIQNVTINDTIFTNWIKSQNITNLSLFNLSVYSRSEADANFALKNDISALQSSTASSYATKTELGIIDSKYAPLLIGPNGTVTNFTALVEKIENDSGGELSMTWKVIIIINCILVVAIILFLIKGMMSG